MAKKREREDRSEVRQEILRIVQERSPISTQALYDALPTRLKHGLEKGHIPGLILTINRGFPGAILSPQRGIYVKGGTNYPEHKEQLSDPKAAPAEDLDASAILDEAVSVIAKLERLVRHLRERDAALSAVRKLLGNV